ncbi:VWA domain-containing protein [Sansalvadorimonas sp. 2012CJ34-2]|uniref:VWA domain-containing protein n=1 Tax=Parendozoicomonas callyspongiae TaxID=2942213 RepID=A0ABT0PEY9_9GAMM|nr:VWA domain-containing protein [Sansalvadorimonas sp. 2012CJ34-2]MCL6269776.1 VWA domain-containing protein [Sansalvadorimonas sp. 2012CJ34-2]
MDIASIFSNFHLLRPWWLLGAIPVFLLIWKLWQQRQQSGKWQKIIPAHLLSHLVENDDQPFSRLPALLTLIAGLITVIALSGPAWRQISTPVEKSRSPLVLVVDLSQSMLAADPSPNRLTRAKQKLTDILRLRQDGLTGLITFAGSSHIVAPLTDDNATLVNLVRSLHPNIMPIAGSHPEKAIAQAVELLRQGAGQAGEILMLTDEITSSQAKAINGELAGTGDTLSILGIGTEAGAPIPAESGGFIRNRDGAIVMAQLDRSALQNAAAQNGGLYRDLSLDNSDINSLLPKASVTDETVRVDRTWDSWHDEGRWLALLILPFAALAFRRGWLFSLFILCFALPPQNSYAFEWNDLWQTRDQTAMKLIEEDPKKATEIFENPVWKAEALDRSGDFSEAAKLFGEQDTPENYYNQGNALARGGELEKALKAYDKALAGKPDFAAAKGNRKIVEDLLKQQQQQEQKNQNQQNQNQDNSENQKQDNNQPQQDSDQSNNDQNQGQNKDDNQNSDQDDQNQDNSSKEEQNKKDQSSSQNNDSANDQQDKDNPQQQNQAEQEQEENQEQYSSPMETQNEESSQDSADTNAWLRRIPDDPGGLLRRKFEQQQQQRAPVQQGEKTW